MPCSGVPHSDAAGWDFESAPVETLCDWPRERAEVSKMVCQAGAEVWGPPLCSVLLPMSRGFDFWGSTLLGAKYTV